jgi:hypothetical protein
MFFRDWSFNDLLAGIFKAFIDLDPKNGLPGVRILIPFSYICSTLFCEGAFGGPFACFGYRLGSIWIVLDTVLAPFWHRWYSCWYWIYQRQGQTLDLNISGSGSLLFCEHVVFSIIVASLFRALILQYFDICELTFDICYDIFLLFSWSHLHLATPSKTMTLTLLLACSGTSGKHDLPCSYCSVYIYIYIYIHDLVWVINDCVIDFVVTADFSVCGSRVVASLGSNKCTP